MSSKLIVLAIGGNSLIADKTHMSVYDQYCAAGETGMHIASLVEGGHRVVVTHGNGPQVGFILLRSEAAKDILHQVPLENCVADTQGSIGYQIEQTLANELKRRGIQRSMAALVTQVVVDADDPAFQNPTKPIGPFYSEEEAKQHRDAEGWAVGEDAGRGWRRMVPSPQPLAIVEEKTIRVLLENEIIVVAVGGGGIPVARRPNGELEGVAAVIDKDVASCLLAKNLKADLFIITTGVDRVAINFGKPDEQFIDRMTLSEARAYQAAGHFPAGSMGPKMAAAIAFLEQGGESVIITQPHLLEEALAGRNGTHIVHDAPAE